MAKESGSRLIANNKKAYHDYFIEDTYEAGIELAGTEVKSMRMGKCSIKSHLFRLNMVKYLYMGCISALMRRETYLIKTRFVQESFCFISMK